MHAVNKHVNQSTSLSSVNPALLLVVTVDLLMQLTNTHNHTLCHMFPYREMNAVATSSPPILATTRGHHQVSLTESDQ